MKNISMMDVVAALMSNGFELEGKMPVITPEMTSGHSVSLESKSESRTELLKGYLKRLGAGEDLESVRADFVKNFSDVEASEIMKAEQELLKKVLR